MEYEGLTRLLLRFVLLLVVSIFYTAETFANCTAANRYCSRQGQKTNKSRKAPFSSNQVPEAVTGFQHPLDNVRFATNSTGNNFAQEDRVSYPNCDTIYHPGLDLNWGKGNEDCGSNIGSVADGVVVWIGGTRIGKA